MTTTTTAADWLRNALLTNGMTDTPNVEAFVAAAAARKHGLNDNDGLIADEEEQALFACLMADDPDLWLPESTLESRRELLNNAVETIKGRFAPRGYDWESHRDSYIDDITFDNCDAVARECLADWEAKK